MHTSRRHFLALAAVALLSVAARAHAPAPAPFKLDHRITLGGAGGWDYLYADPAAHRLYVSHSTKAIVVDTRTDSVIGEVAPAPGIHGIAIAPELGRGWTSNGRDSSVTVFDTHTFATLATVKLPARNPDAILYDPASRRVFTFNGGSSNATVLDARSNEVVGTVPLGGTPEFAVVDGAGKLWVNLEDSSAIVVLDTHRLNVRARWPIAPGEGPSGLALDRAHHRLFAACGNKTLVVVNSENGHVVATAPIGEGVDAVVYDAARGLVLTSNGEGTMTVVRQDSPDRYHVVETVTTERGARTLALDSVTGAVYSATADYGPPPAPTPERPHPRPSLVPGSFRVLVIKP